MTTTDEVAKQRRGRGYRAGIDRDRILEAARAIAPEKLTMQAVADRLGVDRKALHNHVADREGLLRLIAATNFEDSFAAFDEPAVGDWRDHATHYARAVRSGMVATGTLVDYFRFDPAPHHAAFATVEALVEQLLDAGFSEAAAGKSLVLLTELAMMSARDELLQRSDGGHPQVPEVRRALDELPDGAYTALRRLAQTEPYIEAEDQFGFTLRVALAGLEQELDR